MAFGKSGEFLAGGIRAAPLEYCNGVIDRCDLLAGMNGFANGRHTGYGDNSPNWRLQQFVITYGAKKPSGLPQELSAKSNSHTGHDRENKLTHRK